MQEPPFDGEVASFYQTVLQLLSEGAISCAIAGAFALAHHTGIWRITKDLDVFLSAQNLLQSINLFRNNGFDCEIFDPVWLAKIRRDPFFVDLITGMSNAVLVVDESWIERAKPAIVLGVETKILGAEELLVSKLFVSRRERFDGADIAHIIYRSREPLNWDRILELVGVHWELLLWSLVLFHYIYPSQSANVPAHVWEDLLERLRSELSKRDLAAPFRGSLVDDNMFAIDVEEWGLPDLLSEYRARRLKDVASALRTTTRPSKGAA